MSMLAQIVSVTSGFVLFGFHGPDLDLLATAVAVSLVLSGLTASVAMRRGRSGGLWLLIGLGGGLWALAVALVLLPSAPGASARTASSKPPSTPHAT